MSQFPQRPTRTILERGLVELGRLGARVGASAVRGGLEEVHKVVARSAREAERRIKHARDRLERIVDMPQDEDDRMRDEDEQEFD